MAGYRWKVGHWQTKWPKAADANHRSQTPAR
ncbi:hypothetical protein EMIT0158MI4_40263 [Burkholderia ambifaria]